jgi:hypothetical protein
MSARFSSLGHRLRHSALVVRFALGLLAVALLGLLLFADPFLSISRRVDADVLVVEGWIPDYMLPAAAKEYREGRYSMIFVSGLQDDPGAARSAALPDAVRTSARLVELGVPRPAVVPCLAPFVRWLRTSSTAKAVSVRMGELGIKPNGINVMTAGSHGRETWVAYQHRFGRSMPVGILPLPRNDYPPSRWWRNRLGWYWVPKDGLAWLKELLFGLRA